MGRFRDYVKWSLFFSSYIPLYLILAFKYRGGSVFGLSSELLIFGEFNISTFSSICIVLSVFSSIVLIAAMRVRHLKEPEVVRVNKYRSRNRFYALYVAVYILPFIDRLDVPHLLVLFLLLGFVQIHSDFLHVNPILFLFGYHLYEIENDSREFLAISKKRLRKSENLVEAVELSSECYIVYG